MATEGPTLSSKHPVVARTEFERDPGESPTVAIVKALEDATGADQQELRPLYESVETDAIDALFGGERRSEDSGTVLRFRVATWIVFVCSNGQISDHDGSRTVEREPVFG